MILEAKIEAILFWKGEPVSVKELAKFLEVDKKEISTALEILEKNFIESSRGLTLVRNGSGVTEEVMLYTAPAASELIKKLAKDELSRDISKAAVEVLSLIIYRGPISKRDIDYIRGVNSSYILRNLLVRGLVERTETAADGQTARSFVYQPTFDLLSHLGVSKREDLPDFAKVQADIAEFMTREAEVQKETQPESESAQENG